MHVGKFAREYMQKLCPLSQPRAFFYFDNQTKAVEFYLTVLKRDDAREQVTRKIMLPSNTELPPGLDLKTVCHELLQEAGHTIINDAEVQ